MIRFCAIASLALVPACLTADGDVGNYTSSASSGSPAPASTSMVVAGSESTALQSSTSAPGATSGLLSTGTTTGVDPPGVRLLSVRGSTGELYRIEASTGAAEILCAALRDAPYDALAFDSAGTLYGASESSPSLRRIDLGNCDVAVLAPVAGETGFAALAQAPMEEVYAIGALRSLIRVEPSTGIVDTILMFTAESAPLGIVRSADALVFAVGVRGSQTSVWEIDVDAGDEGDPVAVDVELTSTVGVAPDTVAGQLFVCDANGDLLTLSTDDGTTTPIAHIYDEPCRNLAAIPGP